MHYAIFMVCFCPHIVFHFMQLNWAHLQLCHICATVNSMTFPHTKLFIKQCLLILINICMHAINSTDVVKNWFSLLIHYLSFALHKVCVVFALVLPTARGQFRKSLKSNLTRVVFNLIRISQNQIKMQRIIICL